MSSYLPASVIEKARAEADLWERAKSGAIAAAIICGPVITPIGGLVVAGGWATVAAITYLLGTEKVLIAERKANDPPSPDFEARVVARPRRVDRSAFGDSPLEETIVDTADSLYEAVAFEKAMVRADEGAQSAALHGAESAQNARLADALKLATQAAVANDRVRFETNRLADNLDKFAPGSNFERPYRTDWSMVPNEEIRLNQALPDSTLAVLVRGGFSTRRLRARFHPREMSDTPFLDFTSGLRNAGAASGTYGDELAKAAPKAYSPTAGL